MKKILLPLIISGLLFSAGTSFGQAGSITIGIRGSACDELVVEWNSTYNFVGAGQNQWTQATMTIAWNQSYGSNVLGTINPLLSGFGSGWIYNGAAVLVGSEYRREVILLSGGYTQDIPTGVNEIIAISLNGSGTANFTISTLNPAGLANTNISSFNHSGEMWSGSFNPGTATGVNLDDRIAWDGTKWCGGSGANFQPGPGDTKPCLITGLNGQLTVWGATVGSLAVQVGGELTIMPGASLTNNGTTTISQPMGLIIGADASGSGSFIDNGTIIYNGSGSSKVQTYINNVAPIGNFHIHQVGPTVKNPAFSVTYPNETGVFLGEFNLQALGTYAYRYSEPGNNWVNFYQTTEPIPTGGGFIMSDVSGAPSTLNMIGELASDGTLGYIVTPSGISALPQWGVTYTSTGGQGNMLFSNPYPSGLDLKQVYTDYNSGGPVVGTTMRVWQHGLAGGTYGNYSYVQRKTSPPAGWLYLGALQATSGVINPGQGFFLELLNTYIPANGDQFYFYNTLRAHLHSPFIKESQEIIPNLLRLRALSDYSQDELIIYFSEGASSGYDENDAIRWASLYDWSMEVGSVAGDGIEMAINAMPEINSQIYTIPLNFKCGNNGSHSFEFTDLESFDSGTEIFLEDKLIGGNWINVITNPVYDFTANTNDALDRFVLHFFGPTGIPDPNTGANAISIYGYGQDAYILNRGTETVKEYVAYDLMGRELHRGTLPNSTVNKVTIGDVTAYYIVKVFTKEGRVYTDKVFINK